MDRPGTVEKGCVARLCSKVRSRCYRNHGYAPGGVPGGNCAHTSEVAEAAKGRALFAVEDCDAEGIQARRARRARRRGGRLAAAPVGEWGGRDASL
eukprot:scaffold1130_cov74-Phaeocystis_antarctica.AAC.3